MTTTAAPAEPQDRPKRRREVTVERLLDAALETFAEIGFAAASVEDVCRRGGFTRGAFYSSFTSKDELFAALWSRETARELARVEQLLAGIEQEADPIAAAVERSLSTFRADRTWVLVQAEYALHAARSPAAAAALREHLAGLRTRLTRMVEDVAARAGLTLSVPAGALVRILVAVHDGLVVGSVATGDGPAGAPGEPAVPELERTALLLLLRAATTA